jgi:hypothetical protein
MKKIILVLAFFVFGTCASYAQSSCSCGVGNGGCTASQTCPSGKIAVCVCSGTGCSSSCNSEAFEMPLENVIQTNIDLATGKNIGDVLSTAYGKNITFEPTSNNFKFAYNSRDFKSKNHWSIFEYLSANGKLTINGHDVDFWKGVEETLIKGGEFSFCTSNASVRMLLNEITFLTGKRYIISSPATNKISGAVRGNTLEELLLNLSNASGAKIEEK